MMNNQDRLIPEEWDQYIAKRVLQRYRRKKYRIIGFFLSCFVLLLSVSSSYFLTRSKLENFQIQNELKDIYFSSYDLDHDDEEIPVFI